VRFAPYAVVKVRPKPLRKNFFFFLLTMIVDFDQI
jgi:hypothetical protein